MPLIRYRSTDVSRLVDGKCACGISMGRLSKVRGRCDEMVVCGMGNIGPWVFDEVLRGIAVVGDDWQVTVDHDGRRDIVALHVEMDDPSAQPAAERFVHGHVRERFPDFWKNRDMGLYELRLAAVRTGTLRGSGRKLRRVIDNRPMTRAEPAGAR